MVSMTSGRTNSNNSTHPHDSEVKQSELHRPGYTRDLLINQTILLMLDIGGRKKGKSNCLPGGGGSVRGPKVAQTAPGVNPGLWNPTARAQGPGAKAPTRSAVFGSPPFARSPRAGPRPRAQRPGPTSPGPTARAKGPWPEARGAGAKSTGSSAAQRSLAQVGRCLSIQCEGRLKSEDSARRVRIAVSGGGAGGRRAGGRAHAGMRELAGEDEHPEPIEGTTARLLS